MRTTTTNTSLTLLRTNGSSVSLINEPSPLHYYLIQALSLPAVPTLPFVLMAHMAFLQGMRQLLFITLILRRGHYVLDTKDGTPSFFLCDLLSTQRAGILPW
jgi:hypothetical protein